MSGLGQKGGPGGTWSYSRRLVDEANHVYIGYSLTLEPQRINEYLMICGKVSSTPLGHVSKTRPGVQTPVPTAPEWPTQDPPAFPAPRVVHPGDVISILLIDNPATGEKVFDDVRIVPFTPVAIDRETVAHMPGKHDLNKRKAPYVSGRARNFSGDDPSLLIKEPTVGFNGKRQSFLGRNQTISGPLLWLYFPGQGRYVLSLLPHPELGFQKAGEVRGGSISFRVDKDSITVESPVESAAGHKPYILYVKADPLWQPADRMQRTVFTLGSIELAELANPKQP